MHVAQYNRRVRRSVGVDDALRKPPFPSCTCTCVVVYATLIGRSSDGVAYTYRLPTGPFLRICLAKAYIGVHRRKQSLYCIYMSYHKWPLSPRDRTAHRTSNQSCLALCSAPSTAPPAPTTSHADNLPPRHSSCPSPQPSIGPPAPVAMRPRRPPPSVRPPRAAAPLRCR